MAPNKTVASVSFHSNHNLSMDVDEVMGISMSAPIRLGEGLWFCEMIVRSANGTLAVNMLAPDPKNFLFAMPDVADAAQE